MSLEVKVPVVGESITEVTIAKWLKKDGDQVAMDEVICELESDKATFELPAEGAGILRIIVAEGETIPIGTVLCSIEDSGNGTGNTGGGATAESKGSGSGYGGAVAEPQPAEAQTITDPQGTPAAEKAPVAESSYNPVSTNNNPQAGNAATIAAGGTKEIKIPTVGESITEVTISKWLKKDGELVALDEVICELESDKATFELPAEVAGTLRIVAEEGATVPVGAVICKIESTTGAVSGAPAAPASTPASAPQPAQAAAATSGGAQTYASGTPSPAAGKILAEKGINANDVNGSGRDGRITKEDALSAQSKPAAPAPAAQPSAPAPKPATSQPASAPAATGSRNQRRERMSSLRKTVARRLVAVKNETAMLTTFNEVDMKPIMDIRAKYKDKFKEKFEVNLGFMSFFVKACTVALQEWPAVNAQLEENEIVFNDFCDISIAVSAPKGLVVPVIRNAESLSLDGVEKEVVRLAKKARENKISIEEMTGGTFTITNGGVFGSMMSTPIINAPQSAILGMHNIVNRPIAINDQVVIRPMMYVALSYDHRIIDGRESVSFLVRVKELLEDPMRLLLGV
ncbi:2-oxoglutarate dehydrogenase complex dihydrolipoyllysine-residue succinyltransferase [Adhaeribacter pallidiroseus]|uniref:Dihydrolipoyllysine-residue succinyltransferase component of 2-oxoglutarate dehydrogenase complex n=1 Tax=Adhaeribacter pallidiroseus TaxID=2072847 RepID=A0A369Q9T6_9BACT|nr:2-oxoglutarate dehydrogenase complex dihydrolipoyllysine-residue succinyltransferase [Adhaeribacter pallidiroseus]RDC61653.1 Dihydrolipoyllysine-residue succinyltransferase [Adhaeribacter pallidiroseus]